LESSHSVQGSEWRPCESRRRPRRPCWATVFMGRRSCLHGLGGNLVLLVRRGCRLGLRAAPGCWCGGRGLRTVFPVQLGLRVAGSCGAVARPRAVVRRNSGLGRWSECFTALYREGNECRVLQLSWMVGFFVFVGASRVCSSHSIHSVFLSGFG
jgi:hypothetical protein